MRLGRRRASRIERALKTLYLARALWICAGRLRGTSLAEVRCTESNNVALAASEEKVKDMMKYGIAWLLGIPASVLVVWYVVANIL